MVPVFYILAWITRTWHAQHTHGLPASARAAQRECSGSREDEPNADYVKRVSTFFVAHFAHKVSNQHPPPHYHLTLSTHPHTRRTRGITDAWLSSLCKTSSCHIYYHMHVLLFGGFDLPLTLTIPRGKTSRGDMKEITSACLEIPRGERLRRSTQCVSRSKACCQSSGANLHALPGDSGCPAVSIHGRERGRWSTGANPSLRGVDGKQQSRRLLELLSLLMSRGD